MFGSVTKVTPDERTAKRVHSGTYRDILAQMGAIEGRSSGQVWIKLAQDKSEVSIRLISSAVVLKWLSWLCLHSPLYSDDQRPRTNNVLILLPKLYQAACSKMYLVKLHYTTQRSFNNISVYSVYWITCYWPCWVITIPWIKSRSEFLCYWIFEDMYKRAGIDQQQTYQTYRLTGLFTRKWLTYLK